MGDCCTKAISFEATNRVDINFNTFYNLIMLNRIDIGNKKALGRTSKISRSQILPKAEAISLEYTRLSVSQDILFRYNFPMRNHG
jgi:hypothetical protein